MEKITSHADFMSKVPATGKAFLLLFKTGSEQSNCAYSNIKNAAHGQEKIPVFAADVSNVKDIHTNYNISTVPSLLIFEDGKFANVIKGCHDAGYYKTLIENEIFRSAGTAGESDVKRVTVYSTPTCSWCNTLKAWLRKNNIRYSDVDVSRDQNAAEALVRRTGQQGVPQTDINGQIVVGFNQQRLKELLEI
jgi:glutaredoxin-like YruB-family protein